MTDLELINDHHAIEAVVNRLFKAVDDRDWQAAHDCFAAQVTFDMTSMGTPGPSILSPQEITAAWEAGLAPIEAIHHQSGNFDIEVAGDSARCSCYGIALHFRRVRSGRNTRTFVGSYIYRLQRAGHAWRISHFKFHLKFIDGNQSLDTEEPA